MIITMNNKISRLMLKLTLLIFISVSVVSCADDTSDFTVLDQSESGYITVSLKCSKNTRADYTEDDDKYNENKIESVILCLWQNDGTKPDGTAKPDYVQIFTGMEATENATLRIPLTSALRQHLFETEPGECHAFAAVNVISPNIDEYTSGGETFTIEDIQNKKVSIAQLRNMVISSEFATRYVQPSFTMDGDAIVTYDASANKATGIIDKLQRSASKITLALSVEELVEQSIMVEGKLVTSYWQPDTEKMLVQLVGGLKTSTLDPDMDIKPAKDEFFSTPIGDPSKEYTFVENLAGKDEEDHPIPDNGNNAGGMEYPFIQNYPFYSYPHVWTDAPDDYAATYMQLSIPWQQVELTEDEDGNIIRKPIGNYRTCYYQVPVIAADSEALQLVRNVSYHVYLHVGILGSFIPEEPMELEDNMEYSAAPWGIETMDVSIPDVRYLVVDQNDFTVNNERSIVIPFYTSHFTIVTDATMTFYRYNYTDAGLQQEVTVSWEQNKISADKDGAPVFTADFDNVKNELTVSHDLDIYLAYNQDDELVSFTQNDGPNKGLRQPASEANWDKDVIDKISYFKKQTPQESEYSKVEFKVTLQHKDLHDLNNDNFKEVITITQFPGIYIQTLTNYYGSIADPFNCNGAQGNTYINGNYHELPGDGITHYLNSDKPSANYTGYPEGYTRKDGWASSIGLHSGGTYQNFNPNMYLITVTTLPEDTPYKIGDPRSNYINNNLGSSSSEDVNAPLPPDGNPDVWESSTYTYRYYNNETTTINYETLTTVADGFRVADAIYPNSNRRKLQYYYPTLEDEAHKMMISPKFRICSSYAGTSWVLNRELARRRAAAYQEMGFPAGRWRLPTYGEVKFIMELAAQYKIPRLFGKPEGDWWYWCANGLVTVPGKSSGEGPSLPDNATGYIAPRVSGGRDSQRARFVYDEWYWGEADLEPNGTVSAQKPIYPFTWGDKPYVPITNP